MRGADRLCVVHCSYLLFSSTKAICASFTLHCVSYRMVSVPWPGAPGYYISFANGQFMFWLLVCLCTSRWARRKRTTQALTQPATSDQWAARTRKRRKRRRRRRRLPHRNVYNYYIQSQQLMILCIKPVLIRTQIGMFSRPYVSHIYIRILYRLDANDPNASSNISRLPLGWRMVYIYIRIHSSKPRHIDWVLIELRLDHVVQSSFNKHIPN